MKLSRYEIGPHPSRDEDPAEERAVEALLFQIMNLNGHDDPKMSVRWTSGKPLHRV